MTSEKAANFKFNEEPEEGGFNVEKIFPSSIFSEIAADCGESALVAHHSKYAWYLFIDLWTQEYHETIRSIFIQRLGTPAIAAECIRDINLVAEGKYDAAAMVKDYVFRRGHIVVRAYCEILVHAPRDDPQFTNMRLDCLDGIYWICSLMNCVKRKFSKMTLDATLNLLASVIESGTWIMSNDWTPEVQACVDSDPECLEGILKESKHVLEATPLMLGLLLSEEIGKKHNVEVSPQALDQVMKLCTRLIKKLESYPSVDNGSNYDIYFWSDFFNANGRVSAFAAETLRRDFLPYFMDCSRKFSKSILANTDEFYKSVDLDCSVLDEETKQKNIEKILQVSDSYRIKVFMIDPVSKSKLFYYNAPDKKSTIPALREKSELLRSYLPLGGIIANTAFDVLKIVSKEELIEFFDVLFPQPILECLLTRAIRYTHRRLGALLMLLGFFSGKSTAFTSFEGLSKRLEDAFRTNPVPSLECNGDIAVLKAIHDVIPQKTHQEEIAFLAQTVEKGSKHLPTDTRPNPTALTEQRPEVVELLCKLLGKLMQTRPTFLDKSVVDVGDKKEKEKVDDDSSDDNDENDKGDDADADAEEEEEKPKKNEDEREKPKVIVDKIVKAKQCLGRLVDAIMYHQDSAKSEPFNKQLLSKRAEWILELVPILQTVSHFILGAHATESSRQSAFMWVLVPVTNWLSGGRTPFAVERKLIFTFGDFVKTADSSDATVQQFALPTLKAIDLMIQNASAELSKHVYVYANRKDSFEKEGKFDMLKAGTKLAAENDAIDHFVYATSQAIYSAGVWLRKISEEMFEHNKSFKKACSNDADSKKIISSIVDRIIMEGYRVSNFIELLNVKHEEPLKKTYSGTKVIVLPEIDNMGILICHAFLRVLQCFPEAVAETPADEHLYETTESTGPAGVKVVNFYKICLFCFDCLNDFLKAPPQDIGIRMLVVPAAERCIMLLGMSQSRLLRGALIQQKSSKKKGKKGGDDEDDEEGEDEEVVEEKLSDLDTFSGLKAALAQSMYTFLKFSNDNLGRAWSRPDVVHIVSEFFALAKEQLGDRIKEPAACASSSSPGVKTTKGGKKKRKLGHSDIPQGSESTGGCKQQ